MEKNRYFAPQISVIIMNVCDVLTTSFDLEDNWKPDPFNPVDPVARARE